LIASRAWCGGPLGEVSAAVMVWGRAWIWMVGPAAAESWPTRPPPAQAPITPASANDRRRGAAVPHDDQAVRGERLEGVPVTPVPMPCGHSAR